MQAFWAGTAADLMRTGDASIMGVLAEAQIRHHRSNEGTQLHAWEATLVLLRGALGAAWTAEWRVLLEFPMLRLGRRADVVLLTPGAVIVLEVKAGAASFAPADCEQAEDYALDLCDFHAGCRAVPIFPVLVAMQAKARPFTMPLALDGVSPVILANAQTLGALLREIASQTSAPAVPLDPAAWMAAPYRPVPTIVEAACMLYGRHRVEDVSASLASRDNLGRTTDAIVSAVVGARAEARRVVVFVTGIPGAGKTLCGLNAAFGGVAAARATFLTGNPTLVHVLREALARDAMGRGADRRVARQQMEGAIQALPRFRDYHVATGEVPAERIVVVDEAQRCWSRTHAVAKTRDRPVRLTDSEPGHLLEIMGRHEGFAGMVCLVGHGQEIHDGEGGLAEWGNALREAGGWAVCAPADVLAAGDARQRLGVLPDVRIVPALHLTVPLRQIRSTAAAAWVDHVLAGDALAARGVAEAAGGVPFVVTRNLAAMRAWLRAAARGTRRCGLLASSGGKRLRAEGLGAELPHMDAKAVARWFLDRWPDVRASDALEVVATEFSCQGLELDFAGLCWDGDLVRVAGEQAWRVRSFRGTQWTRPAGAEAIANQVNTYRVLLTRARYETVIFVPLGDAGDATREPTVLDGVAAFLEACGAKEERLLF